MPTDPSLYRTPFSPSFYLSSFKFGDHCQSQCRQSRADMCGIQVCCFDYKYSDRRVLLIELLAAPILKTCVYNVHCLGTWCFAHPNFPTRESTKPTRAQPTRLPDPKAEPLCFLPLPPPESVASITTLDRTLPTPWWTRDPRHSFPLYLGVFINISCRHNASNIVSIK
jgi:hypothetical protein